MKRSSAVLLFLCSCLCVSLYRAQSPSLCTFVAYLQSLTSTVRGMESGNAQGSRGRSLDDRNQGGTERDNSNHAGDAGGYTVLIVVLVLSSV